MSEKSPFWTIFSVTFIAILVICVVGLKLYLIYGFFGSAALFLLDKDVIKNKLLVNLNGADKVSPTPANWAGAFFAFMFLWPSVFSCYLIWRKVIFDEIK